MPFEVLQLAQVEVPSRLHLPQLRLHRFLRLQRIHPL